jgi:hypothetical protein
VLVLHGVSDNRYGITEHARLLLQAVFPDDPIKQFKINYLE